MTDFQKKLTAQGAVALVVLGTLTAGLIFFSGNISTYSDELKKARMSLADRSAALGELARLQTQYVKKAKGYLTELQGMVPREEDLINVSKDFQFLASQNGVTQTFSFLGENPAAPGSLGSINARIDVNGSMEKIARFIRGIEEFRYVTQVEKVAMNRDQAGGLSASVTFKIFFRN